MYSATIMWKTSPNVLVVENVSERSKIAASNYPSQQWLLMTPIYSPAQLLC